MPLTVSAATPKAGGAPFLKSLIIPGWGQYGLGQKNAALAFFGADIILLGGALTLQSYGKSAEQDYKALAEAHAQVTGDHGHSFYVDVGNWMTVEEYNEERLRDRQYDALYTSAGDAWNWDNVNNRDLMKKTRVKSDRAFNRIYYFAGGMILNHLAAALHAGRVAAGRKAHSNLQQSSGLQFGVTPLTSSKGLLVSVSRSF
jgi:hypothetical protein